MNREILPDFIETDTTCLNIYGARVHNLKNIDVHIPRNRFVVITGLSGSGKSSLAFDTIYAEGQRRYIESFSAYARNFLGNLERPDVDKITGLSPVIAIEQKTTNKNPRSTVGTVTEIYDFLRLLYARVSTAYSPVTGKPMVRFTENQIVEQLHIHFSGRKIVVLSPLVRGRKGHYRELFEKVRKQGYLKIRVDGEIVDIREKMQVDRYKIHDIELVIDRLEVKPEFADRLKTAVHTALKLSEGLLFILDYESGKISHYSKQLMCPESGISYEEPSPNTFSFNSPYGACPSCKGMGVVYEVDLELLIPDKEISINAGGLAPLGEIKNNYVFDQLRKIARKYGFSLSDPIKNIPKAALNYILYGTEYPNTLIQQDYYEYEENEYEGVVPMLHRCYNDSASENLRAWAEEYMEIIPCAACKGTRLKPESLQFRIAGKHIAAVSSMSIAELSVWLDNISSQLSEKQAIIAKDLLKEIRSRVHFLLDVGLEYLSLDRPARTLSGGESQRIRLATQIGSQLMGITYILDEPSIGLHQRDNHRLIDSLKKLTEVGNTVMVVEHDKDIMLAADYIIDLGPGAGYHGGRVVGEGPPETFRKLNTITAQYLRAEKTIPLPAVRRQPNGLFIKLYGASGNNLKQVDIAIPLGVMTCVTGVSGSGKSSLINETLYPILQQQLYRARKKPLPFIRIEGIEHIDKVIEIDQSPIGRTPRSNPATYIGVFADIRTLFAQLPEARIRGYKPGRFSFNVKGGRCEACEGAGMKVIEMNFLPDVLVACENCMGKRYNRETLDVRYKGKSISDILDMTIEEALAFFENHPAIYRKIKVLQDVGLGYITLGQSATTLSGGEAQRVKLAAELSKKDTGKTFYILDEPTTGLHFHDIKILLEVLQQLVERGNTVLIIEHNMDVIKVADWIIDMGPEGGDNGGRVICEGTPEYVATVEKSYTGRFLKKQLDWEKSANPVTI
jgi:excinuclease ABC subunit A